MFHKIFQPSLFVLILLQMNYNSDDLLQELSFKTARSGGKGGQHVNKVSSKVLLIWDLPNSKVFDQEQKDRLLYNLSNRLTKQDFLQLDSSEDRSQIRNKEIVIQRFLQLINEGLKVEKPRIPTKIPKSIVIARLDRKKKQASKKNDRQWRYTD